MAVWTMIPTRETSKTRPEIGTLLEMVVILGVEVVDLVVPGDATAEGVDVATWLDSALSEVGWPISSDVRPKPATHAATANDELTNK